MTVKIHVLCSGPSLNKTWSGPGPGDLVIGVNRTAERYPVDWLCAGDWETVALYALPFRIGWCTQADCLRYARAGGLVFKAPPPADWRGVAWEDLPCRLRYSGPTAIAFAGHLGAHEIHVYGADMLGYHDFTGGSENSDRMTARWQEERPLFDSVCAWVRTQGIPLIIHR